MRKRREKGGERKKERGENKEGEKGRREKRGMRKKRCFTGNRTQDLPRGGSSQGCEACTIILTYNYGKFQLS